MQPALGRFAVSSGTALQKQKQPQTAGGTGDQQLQKCEHSSDQLTKSGLIPSRRSELNQSQQTQSEPKAASDTDTHPLVLACKPQKCDSLTLSISDKSSAALDLLSSGEHPPFLQQSEQNAASYTDKAPAGSSVLATEDHSEFLQQSGSNTASASDSDSLHVTTDFLSIEEHSHSLQQQLAELQAAKNTKQQQLQATIDKCKRDKEELESGVNRKISALEQKYQRELDTAQQKFQQGTEQHVLKMADLKRAAEQQQRDSDRRVNLILRAKEEVLASTDPLLQEMLGGLSDPTRYSLKLAQDILRLCQAATMQHTGLDNCCAQSEMYVSCAAVTL